MFNKLISSKADRLGWLKHPWVIGISIAVHVVLLGALLWAAAADEAEAAEDEIDPEDITYIDVTEIEPPPEMDEPAPEPEATPPEPQPQEAAPRPTPRAPRVTPPAVTEPDRPAGFQELQPPRELAGIPAPDASQEEVSAEDFGGRGTPGGVAGGEPPPPGPPPSEAGTGSGGSGADPNATYTANAVDRIAELRNRSDVARTLQRLYPSHLRDAGVGGRVVATFVIDANGRVESSSIRINSAPHPDLAEATRRALADLRFRPAQKGNRNVRQITTMPIVWQVPN